MSTLSRTWQSLKTLWAGEVDEAAIAATLAEVRAKQPAPVVWLFGKTQSGKSSIVKFLTGADRAAIGSGFRPCTAATFRYPFPDTDAAVLEFLDTRGLDDPHYNPAADIAAFRSTAHAMIVTVKITDFAQKTVIDALREIRRDNPGRHVILALTCLHEALNGIPHGDPRGMPVLDRLAEEQRRQFEGLFDSTLLLDLTKPEEGFTEPNYNGAALKAELLHQLPQAYRHSLEQNLAAVQSLRDLHQSAAGPVIAGYAGLAASAAAVPVPFVDLILLPAIQARMVYALANVYNQDLTTSRFVELAGSVGVGLLVRQAVKELAKLVPVVGSAVAAATAFASTYALGKAFCLYFERVHDGHLPEPDVLKTLYAEQFAAAKKRWAS